MAAYLAWLSGAAVRLTFSRTWPSLNVTAWRLSYRPHLYAGVLAADTDARGCGDLAVRAAAAGRCREI